MSRAKRLIRTPTARRLLSWAIAGYIRLVRATSRMAEDGPGLPGLLERYARGAPCIITFWHGRLLLMPRLRRRLDMAHVLISQHGDGELIAAVLDRLGIHAVRGSSRRGGAAALRILHTVLDRGALVGITPDGPRGPRMRAAAGAIALARHTQVPVYPLAFGTKRGWVMASWDRFLLPTPFNRGVFLVGAPLTVPADADDETQDHLRLALEAELNAVTFEADRRTGREPVQPAPAGP